MRQQSEKNAARFGINENLRNKKRKTRTKNAACIIPVYKLLGNTNPFFRHLGTAVNITVCYNINKTVFTKHKNAYENYFLWNLAEL